MLKQTIALAAGVSIFASCGVKNSEDATTAVKPKELSTINVDYLDKSESPTNDFFRFANGTWLDNNPVPASESRWGSFNELDQSNKDKLTLILDAAAAKNSEAGSTNQIIGDYYASFIDMDKRNADGDKELQKDLSKINALKTKAGFSSLIAQMHKDGADVVFGLGVGQDLKDVDNNITYFGQAGIGLPNKNYYFDEDKKDILDKYKVHVARMFTLAGYDNANSRAEKVIALETKLAKGMMAPDEMREPEKTYNKVARKDVIKQFGNFDFDNYLAVVGSQSFDTLIVSQVNYPKHVSKLMDDLGLGIWKNYLAWHYIDAAAGHLNQEYVDANFDFFGKVLSGKSEMKPINERAINEITAMPFAELLGKAFVEKHFSKEAKDKVNQLVDNLLTVFEGRIKNLDWMSEETKKQALTKLASIGRKLGYPEEWEDFSTLKISKESYLANVKAANEYETLKNFADLSKPVDKSKWGMPAHMVNAYYHPMLNEIAFPAGIMQPPFFDVNAEDAVNYGSIGMVIGHEFTHGFDDMGSKFAADGSFTNWWTADDRTAFEERTGKLGNTFSHFCPIDGHCVNPQLTMGENIADLGGITMAYHAYTMTDDFKANVIRDGFTPAQRFFLSYAQLWKINYTEEELKNRLENDPHSPGMYRVNGPLMNCPEFFAAFDVKEGDKMRNSEESISRIW